MKPKHLFLVIATLVAAGGLWFARTAGRTHRQLVTSEKPNGARAVSNRLVNDSSSTNRLRPPPNPNRRFWELTPEQRVQRARHPGDVGG